MIDPITQYILEGYITDDKSISIDLNKFESGESDKLVINGLSGSGKTTLGKILGKKYKCESLDTDKMAPRRLIDLFKGASAKEQKVVFKKLWTNVYKPVLEKPGRAVIEGAMWQVYAYYPNTRYLMNEISQIILGTSALKASIRRYKRFMDKYDDPKLSDRIDKAYNSIKLNFVEIMPAYKTFRKERIKAGGDVQPFKMPKLPD